MRRIACMCVIVAAMASASVAVTDEELAEQTAVVTAEQATLDSLTSVAHAETWQAVIDSTDSLLTANLVTAELVTPAAVTGLRDPIFIDVDLTSAYGTWDAVTRRLWAIELREAGTGALFVSTGRYSIHTAEAQRLLDFTGTFITSTEEEE